MYYIIELIFPNGIVVTVTIPAISEKDAIDRMKNQHPDAEVTVLGSHGA